MKKAIIPVLLLLGSIHSVANAAIISVFDSSWTDMTVGSGEDYDDTAGLGVQVYPGYGGQAFDAEYLFYKLVGNTLSIGLQTGFDLSDGQFYTGGRNYYAGELALSFNGDTSNYEYGIDFGFLTRDYSGNTINTASQVNGLYENASWSGALAYGAEAPFGLSGDLVTDVNFSGTSGHEGSSYYQVASFDIGSLDITQLDAHWTMSCGNDAIDGAVEIRPNSVPEPSAWLLMSTGLLGLLGGLAARRKKKV